MSDPLGFTKMVPGFDFLQGLVKNAGSALPSVGQWVAPTLNPEELERRIQELKTVQFWLEQNARMLGTTIQALEVQRMTLTTLKSMNVSMNDLREKMTLKVPGVTAPAEEAPAAADTSGAPAGVDPMQWWGALTKQFTDIAATAMSESTTGAAKNLAGEMVRQSLDAAGETLKQAVAMPAAVAQQAAEAVSAATAATKSRKRSTASASAEPAAAPSAARKKKAV